MTPAGVDPVKAGSVLGVETLGNGTRQRIYKIKWCLNTSYTAEFHKTMLGDCRDQLTRIAG